MQRRDFFRTVETSAVVGTGTLLAAQAGRAAAPAAPPPFKIGMYLPELGLPFDPALATAARLGAKYIWFNRVPDEPEIADLTDARARQIADRVAAQGLEIFLLNAGNPFKKIHLTDLDLKTMTDHPEFRRDLQNLERSMQIAAEIGVKTVGSFTFAWPGEYSAGKPTWPMRWLTRGGVIAEVDAQKWLKAFSLVAQRAEKYDVDVALSMMPWNYTNTTGHFRQLVERLGSRRIKVMWGPADNLNCGEWDTATAGFQNVRPFLHGLHLKDLTVRDGLQLDFEYCPLGRGDVDFTTVFRQLRQHQCDVFLSVSTHFLPPGGSRVEAMRINMTRLQELLKETAKEA